MKTDTPTPSNTTLIDFWNTIQGKTYGENLTIDYGRLLAWFETAFNLETELTAVTEQRDKARSEAIKMSEKYNTAWKDRFQSGRVRDKFSWENNQTTEP